LEKISFWELFDRIEKFLYNISCPLLGQGICNHVDRSLLWNTLRARNRELACKLLDFTWRRSSQKRVVRTKLDIYVFISTCICK
jgi:hypothetical protein